MAFLVSLLLLVLTVVQLVCFIMVVVKMFQMGSTGVGIATIILALFCGIGFLIAFIWGWLKVGTNPSLKNIMIGWTVVWLLNILIAAVGYGTGSLNMPANFPQ